MYALRRLEMHMAYSRQSKKKQYWGFGYLCYLKLYVIVNSSHNVLNRNKPIVFLKKLRSLAQYDGACLHSQHRESKIRCQSYL